MAGFVRKITQLPPGRACCSCSLTQDERITYYIDTGILTEVEGPNFICDRCFWELVRVSGQYLSYNDHRETILTLNKNIEDKLARLEKLEEGNEILKREFNLDVDDLYRYTQVKPQVAEMTVTQKALRSKIDTLQEQTNELQFRKSSLERSYQEVVDRIEEKNRELSDLIESNLTQILDKRGRSDLVDVLLNNRIPQGYELPITGDEQESPENLGEFQPVITSF